MEFYRQNIEDIFDLLACDKKGLSAGNVRQRQQNYGLNTISVQRRRHPVLIFFDQFKSFIIYILLFAVIFSIAIGEYIDCIIILAILIANTLIGFFQELSAAQSLAALKKLTSVKSRVLRDGQWNTLDAGELVPGDVISLAAGDKVPADCRIVKSVRLEVDQSSLTGESVPVRKKEGNIENEVQIGEQKNMLFSATSVITGNAEALVCTTGMDTEIGIITKLVKEAKEEMTPLQRKLDHFGRRLGIAIICICIFVLLASCAKEMMSQHFISKEMLISFAFIAISLAVAAVPTALPAVVTIALSIGVKRLLKRKALVRRLSSVETLGSCDVICTDKTGTLTCNEMTVRKAWIPDQEMVLDGVGYRPEPALDISGDNQIFAAGLFCNNASLFFSGSDWKINGNPTEAALLVSAAKAGVKGTVVRRDELPFDSDRKCMSVLVEKDNDLVMYTKGAPDKVLDKCTHVFVQGKKVLLDNDMRSRIIKQNDDYASQAMRVLSFSCKPISSKQEFVEEKLTFIGLQAMIDPPRKDVIESIKITKKAGIRVIMVTGDYPETARSIGAEIGIRGKVLTGKDMENLSEEDLCQELDDGVAIFARVVPEHKQRIVKALQATGHVVAMTGDGVNDAPALKKANIGIAVGSGTEVAKEASDFVLLDDSFSHIVSAIEEGRGIYDNIQKSIMLLLSGNLGEVLIIFLAVIMGMNLPLTAIMLLWINMVTDGAPALAFSVDRYGSDIMQRKPKPGDESILPKRKLILITLLGCIGTIIALFLFNRFGGNSQVEEDVILARTMVFNFVVLYEMILVFVIRQAYQVPFFSNIYIWISIVLGVGLQALIMYTPLQPYFDVAALGLQEIGWLLAAAFSFYLASLFYHFIMKKRAA